MSKPVEIITVILILLSSAPAQSAEEPKIINGDGRLALFNYHEDEYLEETYRNEGKYIDDALRNICHIFRSPGDGRTHTIDVRLIELIDNIQDHFGAETVEIISGYRSPGYNRQLKLTGHDVARESLHMRGKAADIHIDEVREEDVFEYVKDLGAGGAGLYPRFSFVHIDLGPPRTWMEKPDGARILAGTENNPNDAWAAVTDKNTYRRGETLELTVRNNSYDRQRLVKNVWAELFRRGKWAEHDKIGKIKGSAALQQGQETKTSWKIPKDQPFGKYRLVVFTSRDFSIPPAYSNEFYVKKMR